MYALPFISYKQSEMIFALFRNPLPHKSAFAQVASDSWRGLQPLEPRLLLSGSPTHLADLLPANGGDGSSGFVATGIDAGDQSGYSAKSAGDINGDGMEDLVIGAPSAGEVYIVYGSSDGLSATVNLEELNGTNGLRLVGNSAEQAGFSVSSAGDMNNDGFDALIIGAPASDPAATNCDVDNTVGLNTCDAGTAPGFTLFGDANNDGLVTGLDLIAVQQNFGATGLSDGLLHGDANDDGLVTGLDLIVVQQNFGHVSTPNVGEEQNDLPTAPAGTDTRTFTTTITDTHGNYGFSEIGPGTFTASEQLQSEYVQTAPMNPDTHTITTFSRQNIDGLDFGNQANNISAANNPPVAVPDSLTVTKGKTATILDSGAASVLDNDNGLAPVLDANEIGWSAVDNLTNNQFAENVAAHKNQNLLIDIEVHEDDGQAFISGVWQQNIGSRLWAEHHNLTSGQFGDLWLQYHNSGYRLIDQEAYVLNGQWYYAGIWIENLEGYAWVSYQNETSSEFSDRITEYEGDYILSDFDAYVVDNSTRYAHLWVENTQMLQWKLHRDMTAGEFSHFSNKYKRSYRIHDIESYQIDGQQHYAAIWIENRNGRSWVDLRDAGANNYQNHWIHYRDLGYRLTDFEKYETSDGVRHVGVWRQNTDRPDWYMRSEIDTTANAHLAEHGIPGMSIAIVHQGEIKYMRGFGHQDIAENRWYSAHTINRLASVSKAVGGVLLLKLADQDQIDPLALTRDYAPELPVHHTHTLEQLVSNRAGVGHYSQLGLGTIYTQYDTAIEASALFSNEDLVTAPGASYYYSTHGYTLLGAGIEGATGQAIADVIYNELGSGLGLATLKAEDRSIENEFRTKLYNTNNTEAFADNISWKILGGGLEASAYDLIRFSAMLMDGQILSNESLEHLWTVPEPDNVSYALGWTVATHQGEFSIRKNGSQLGANTYLRLFPELNLGIVVLSNRRYSEPGDLSSDIANAILASNEPENNSQGIGETLTAILVTNVAHGNLVFNSDGTFSYTHDGSETINDSFTYKAHDGLLDSNIVTVAITVNPVPLVGDANNDNQVTGLDLITVQQNFGAVGAANGLLYGDANDDGLVTGLDLIAVQQNFGHVSAPTNTASNPHTT